MPTARQAISWRSIMGKFNRPKADRVAQHLDITTLERCAEAWARAARAAETRENDAAKASECRTRAAALRDRIEAMKAEAEGGPAADESERGESGVPIHE